VSGGGAGGVSVSGTGGVSISGVVVIVGVGVADRASAVAASAVLWAATVCAFTIAVRVCSAAIVTCPAVSV